MSEQEKNSETPAIIPTETGSKKLTSLDIAEGDSSKSSDTLEQSNNVEDALSADEVEPQASSEEETVADGSTGALSDEDGIVSSNNGDSTDAYTSAQEEAETDKPSDLKHSSTSETLKRLLTNKMVLIGLGAVVVVIVLAVLLSTHVICFHEWASATCTEPEECEICGRTKGEPLGHDWSEATCTDPEICSRCGKVQGKALGHSVDNWETDAEATCSATGARHGVCSRCGETIEETVSKLTHTPGEWITKEKAKISPSGNITPGTRAQLCSVCGQEIKTESFTPEISVSKKNALRTAGSYLKTMPFSESGLVKQLEYEGYSHDDAAWGVSHCGANWNEQAAKSAKSYLKMMGFSHSGLVQQLEYEGYTHEQAEYGVTQAGL